MDPETGQLIAVHVRKDLPGGKKKVWWEKPDGTAGLDGLKLEDFPLYGAEQLRARPDEPVVITEGEPAQTALDEAGLLAVGTVTGAAIGPSIDVLRCLKGRDVILWPDNDDDGASHMERIAQQLAELGIQARRLVWKSAPRKGDAADFFERGETVEQLWELIATAPRWDAGSDEKTREEPGKEEPADDWKALVSCSSLDDVSLPYYFDRLVSHIKPYTPMFPTDWPVMMVLSFWSSLWPGVRLQNLNMVLWALGIQLQGVGKNVATDELERTVRGIAGKNGRDIVLYTAGTPEGIWDALAGEQKQMLAYLDEFGGYLKLLRRDHMQGARETLCSLYDGRAVGYLRAQKNGVGITDPHFVIAATATPTAIRDFVEPQDLTNGFLSRFLVCAPDGTRTAPDYYPDDGHDRQDLVDEISRHLLRLQRVKTVVWQETGKKDPPRLNAYREHLGMGSGEVINLDDHMAQETIPAGRLVARAKKIAALLELAEANPNLNKDDSSIIEIRPENLETAIDIVEHGLGYATRLRGWVGQSSDYELSRQIVAMIRDGGLPLSQRELCRRTHRKSADVKTAIELALSAGLLAPAKKGKAIVWALA